MEWSRWPFYCYWGTRSGPERCSPLMKSQRGTRHLAAMLLAIPPAPHPARRYLSLDTTRRCVRRRSGRPDSRGFAVTFAHAMTALGHPTKLRADLLPANVGNGSIAPAMHQGTTAPPSAHSLAISPPHWIPSIVAGGRHAGTAAAHSAGSGGLRYLRAARRRQVPSHGCSEGHRPI